MIGGHHLTPPAGHRGGGGPAGDETLRPDHRCLRVHRRAQMGGVAAAHRPHHLAPALRRPRQGGIGGPGVLFRPRDGDAAAAPAMVALEHDGQSHGHDGLVQRRRRGYRNHRRHHRAGLRGRIQKGAARRHLRIEVRRAQRTRQQGAFRSAFGMERHQMPRDAVVARHHQIGLALGDRLAQAGQRRQRAPGEAVLQMPRGTDRMALRKQRIHPRARRGETARQPVGAGPGKTCDEQDAGGHDVSGQGVTR